MEPWLTNASFRESFDQASSDLLPEVVVRATGHPPSAGNKAICPLRTIANCFPSGESTGLRGAEIDSRSSGVIDVEIGHICAGRNAAANTAIVRGLRRLQN
jgi:hypothetical protein